MNKKHARKIKRRVIRFAIAVAGLLIIGYIMDTEAAKEGLHITIAALVELWLGGE